MNFRLPIGAAVLFLAMGATTSCAGSAESSADGQFTNIIALASQRLALAVPVAQWKWHNHKAIEDKPREAELLRSLLPAAHQYGIDTGDAQRFFTDQMSASKEVQNALFTEWRASMPPPVPAATALESARKDLSKLSQSMLVALAQTSGSRHADDCPLRLAHALENWKTIESVDSDQSQALNTALAHVCASGGIGAGA